MSEENIKFLESYETDGKTKQEVYDDLTNHGVDDQTASDFVALMEES